MQFIKAILEEEKPENVSEKVHQNRINQKIEIMQTAFRLFSEKGYHKTTLEDIGSEIGITRAALYRYFDSKDELLFKCHEVVYLYQIKKLEKLKLIEDPEIRLKKMLEAHIYTYFDKGSPKILFPILISLSTLASDYKHKIIEFRKKIESYYIDCIADFKKVYPGQLKNIDNQIIVNTLLGTLNSVPRWLVNLPGTTNPNFVIEQVINILLDGIKKNKTY